MKGAITGVIAGHDYEFDNTSDYDFPRSTSERDSTADTLRTVAGADAEACAAFALRLLSGNNLQRCALS